MFPFCFVFVFREKIKKEEEYENEKEQVKSVGVMTNLIHWNIIDLEYDVLAFLIVTILLMCF